MFYLPRNYEIHKAFNGINTERRTSVTFDFAFDIIPYTKNDYEVMEFVIIRNKEK
ncbi:MAG: hypothetical protein LBO69_02505 [Ignavibacteria bacterium]|jgi:hypothetical protein|nr:hypothetical protein [Ignavibacteria bacterium]